jgi:hypothetical protein
MTGIIALLHSLVNQLNVDHIFTQEIKLYNPRFAISFR